KPIYTSSVRESLAMYKKPSQYQFDGVAFLAPMQASGKEQNIYVYEHKNSGEVRYAGIDKESELSDRNFVRDSKPAFTASTKPADGLEAVHQINDQNSDQTFLVFENDPLYEKAENKKQWKRIDSVFYAKPSSFGFNWSPLSTDLSKAQNTDSSTDNEKSSKHRVPKDNDFMPAYSPNDPITNPQNLSQYNDANEFSLEDGVSEEEEMILLNQIIAAHDVYQSQENEDPNLNSPFIQNDPPLI
ncbi:MAG: hypothetical protein CL862_00660, partial [Cyanobium sp. NAT70]|nr:hypothetical protein [Cyanobium sp. NAT70]